MDLKLFNSLTKKKEKFFPISKDQVSMYVCGPTVYDRPHIGNARSVVCFDILYRVLMSLYGHGKVQYVRNITDVDDKIIYRAAQEGVAVSDLTTRVTKQFHADMDYLYCHRPNHEPKATESIAEIIDIIEKLIEKGAAYASEGHVYFDVSKCQDYCKLSGQSQEDLLKSVRIEQSDGKKNSADFVLWKPAKASECNFSAFESPFSYGRPGWHIECSAMSHKFFGENFDIHGGGIDLVFPHHTNEIAQSCSAYPGSNYAKYWVHNGFLTINREKMSKSLGNFLTVKDLIDKGVNGEVIRLFLISSHYRKPLDYNEKAVSDSSSMLDYWYRAIEPGQIADIKLPEEFIEALCDDLNTHKAITIINDFAKKVHASEDESIKSEYRAKLFVSAKFLGLLNCKPGEWFHQGVDAERIQELVDERSQAKLDKNWNRADEIRQRLLDLGVTLEDSSKNKTEWKKIT